MPFSIGAVCVEERLVSKQGPKKVEGRRGRGDLHVRRRGQESIFVMCEKRVTLLERDDENASTLLFAVTVYSAEPKGPYAA